MRSMRRGASVVVVCGALATGGGIASSQVAGAPILHRAFVWAIASKAVPGRLQIALTVRCGGAVEGRPAWVLTARKADAESVLRDVQTVVAAGRYGFRWQVDGCTTSQRDALFNDVFRRLRARHALA